MCIELNSGLNWWQHSKDSCTLKVTRNSVTVIHTSQLIEHSNCVCLNEYAIPVFSNLSQQSVLPKRSDGCLLWVGYWRLGAVGVSNWGDESYCSRTREFTDLTIASFVPTGAACGVISVILSSAGEGLRVSETAGLRMCCCCMLDKTSDDQSALQHTCEDCSATVSCRCCQSASWVHGMALSMVL